MSKSKKDKLILKTGDMSQAKVKSYREREDTPDQVVSRGRDITINHKR